MILSCEKCSTNFMVADDAIPDAGRKVKCGSCQHVWHQEPKEELSEEAKKELEEVKQSQAENLKQAVAEKAKGVEPKLPAIYKDRSAPLYLKIAAGVMLLLNICGFVYFNKETIGVDAVYAMLGQYDTSGVKIEKVLMRDPFVTENEVVHYIDWKVKNISESEKKMPQARLSLLNKNREVVLQNTGSVDKILLPDEEYIFKANKIADKGKKGRYLLVEIGNGLELSSR